MWRDRIASLERMESGKLWRKGTTERMLGSSLEQGRIQTARKTVQKGHRSPTSLSLMAGMCGFINDEQCDDQF